jgi:hypothetical protein
MPVAQVATGRREKGECRTSCTNVFEESDSGIVPMNHSNKSGRPVAEGEEKRPLIKENTHQSNTHSTQSLPRVVVDGRLMVQVFQHLLGTSDDQRQPNPSEPEERESSRFRNGGRRGARDRIANSRFYRCH